MTEPRGDEVAACIKAARELLSEERRWVQGHTAMDATRRFIVSPIGEIDDTRGSYPTGPSCFCLTGALMRTAHEIARETTALHHEEESILRAAVSVVYGILEARGQGFLRVPAWNDSPLRAHVDVLKILDEAHALRLAEIGAA